MNFLPDGLRRLYHTAVPLPFKYGRAFREALATYEANLRCSREEIEDLQWRLLKSLIDYCYHHVPYYKRVFASHGLTPDDIQHRSDFGRIPVLTKEDVDRHREELKSDEFDKFEPIKTVTSATTRDGLVLYRSRLVEAHRHAVVWRFYRSIGYDYRRPRARLTTPLNSKHEPDQFPVDFSENCLFVHPLAATRELAPRVYEQLQKFQPELVLTQPSNATMLATYWKEQGLEPLNIPLIVSIGEMLYPEYRRIIAEYFGGVVHDYYGNRENSAAAGTDAAGNLLIYSDYCFLEFETNGGKQGAPQGNIISTSLHNYAFPLLRYHTEDLGEDTGYPDDATLPFPSMRIMGGRGKDLLLTRDGLKLPNVTSVLRHNNLNIHDRVQLEQLSIDELVVRIVPSAAFDRKTHLKLVEEAFRTHLNDEFRVTVEVVDRIESSESGKYRLVISQLAMDELRRSLKEPAGD